MKKFYAIAAIAATVLALASCNKEGSKEEGKEEQVAKKEYRIATMDGKPFTYDAQGRVTSYGDEEESREFVYDGNKLTINNIYKGEKSVEYTAELDEAGRVTKLVKGDNTYVVTYDKNGYAVKNTVNGEENVKTETATQTVEDGNIIVWTRWDPENSYLRQKKHTFLDVKNVGEVCTGWAEDLCHGKRFMWEAGLFGKTSAYVVESCRWFNFGDEPAEKTAVYDYEYDANGYITKETKYYGVWNETDMTGMDKDDEHTFTWEKIQ